MPILFRIAASIDRLNLNVGRVVAWTALLMVLVQFSVVILRYVFAFSNTALSESIWYLHGILFMLGASYALLFDEHVRVDIFYREASARRKARVDLLGALIFLIPLCIITIVTSWDYVIHSWEVLEGSTELAGLPLIFLYKTVIWAFGFLLGLQALAMALKAWLFLRGQITDYKPGPLEPGDLSIPPASPSATT